MLIASGLNVVWVSRQLGHASADITLSVYAHQWGAAEHAEQASARMQAVFGSVLEPSAGTGNAMHDQQADVVSLRRAPR